MSKIIIKFEFSYLQFIFRESASLYISRVINFHESACQSQRLIFAKILNLLCESIGQIIELRRDFYDGIIILFLFFFFLHIDTDCCTRQCCGPARPFDMKILDNSQREVIHLNRPLRCTGCCCPCFLQEVEVTAPPGTPIGYIVQK